MPTPRRCAAALAELAKRNGGRRIAVVGGMAELGAEGSRYHREIGELLDPHRPRDRRRRARPRLRHGGVGPGRRRGGERLARAPPAGRRRARQGLALGRPRAGRAETARTNGTSPRRGPAGHAHLDRRRTEVHRVPPPERDGPAHPRGRPRRPPDQAGDADHGRPAAGLLGDRRLPGAQPLHDRGTGRLRRDARVRRGRLCGRLHQAPPSPLARPRRPLEARPPRRRSPSGSRSRSRK